jgi:hypothetical protein
MSNPFNRLEELDQELGAARTQLKEVNSQLATLGSPPYLDSPANVSPDPVPGEVLSKQVPALTPEEQQQKAEHSPNKLELYTTLSTEKDRLEQEVGSLAAERAHVEGQLDQIEQLRGELGHVDGQIKEAKAENIEALKAYDDKITDLKDATDRRYTVRDLGDLKDLDGKIDEVQERLSGLEGRRNDIVMEIRDAFRGNAERDLGEADTGAIGTEARPSKLEIGPAGELSERSDSLEDKKQEHIVHLGNEVMDATRETGQQLEEIGKNTNELGVPYPPPTEQTIGICEKPWGEFMPQASAITDPGLLVVLGLGAVFTVGKDIYDRLDKEEPDKSRTREIKQLSRDYCDDMRDLGNQQQEERVALVESLQGRHADEATIESQTAKQRDLHADQTDQRQKDWDEKFSDMWKKQEKDLTPYDREKLAAPSQVQERINEWEKSGFQQILQREQQAPER